MWSVAAIEALLALSLNDLLLRANESIARITRPIRYSFFTLLSVETGGCPEDCAYSPQRHVITAGRKVRMLSLEHGTFAPRAAQVASTIRSSTGMPDVP
jgi:biotin synthase-like enzyme